MKKKKILLLLLLSFILIVLTACGGGNGSTDVSVNDTPEPDASNETEQPDYFADITLPPNITNHTSEDETTPAPSDGQDPEGSAPENDENAGGADDENDPDNETGPNNENDPDGVSDPDEDPAGGGESPTTSNPTAAPQPTTAPTQKGSRDNTPVCLTPTSPETNVLASDTALIDISNAGNGYVCAAYYGTCGKVKLQITGPDGVTYTYNLSGGKEYFPLSAQSGVYTFGIYENIVDNQYGINLSESVNISITNSFGAFLYPNQYCMFNSGYTTVAKASELAYSANSDLDVISNVYNYVINNISYDYNKAVNVASGYVSNVDHILSVKCGICLDYAAVMTCMLRSQGIPTRLEVGYAGSAYHAWISTYVNEVGWINGMISFDGVHWSLMDPTFAATSSEADLASFIGDGSNYVVKYVY